MIKAKLKERKARFKIDYNKRLNLHFVLSDHDTATDGLETARQVNHAKPDVLSIEAATYTEQEATNFDKVFHNADIETPYHATLRDNLNSQPKIFTLERFTPAEANAIQTKQEIAANLRRDAFSHLRRGDTKSAITSWKEGMILETKVNSAREEHIKKKLANLGKELLAKYPSLRRKNKINVAINYGHNHSPLYYHAKTLGFNQVTADRSSSIVRHLVVGPTIRLAFNRLNWEPTDNQAASALLAEMISNLNHRVTSNYNKATTVSNLAAQHFTAEKLAQLFTRIKEAGIETAFKEHDLPLPTSEQDLDTFLRKRKIKLRQ